MTVRNFYKYDFTLYYIAEQINRSYVDRFECRVSRVLVEQLRIKINHFLSATSSNQEFSPTTVAGGTND